MEPFFQILFFPTHSILIFWNSLGWAFLFFVFFYLLHKFLLLHNVCSMLFVCFSDWLQTTNSLYTYRVSQIFCFVLFFGSTLPASPATCLYCLSRGWECLWSDAHRWSIYDPSAPIMNVFPRQKHSSLSQNNSQFRDIQCLTINSKQTKTERNRHRILFFRCSGGFVVWL